MKQNEEYELPSRIDLNELAKQYDVQVVAETREIASLQEARLKEERLNAAYKRRKDWVLFRVTLVSAIALGITCILIIFFGSALSAANPNFAAATLTSMVVGAIAYLSGKPG